MDGPQTHVLAVMAVQDRPLTGAELLACSGLRGRSLADAARGLLASGDVQMVFLSGSDQLWYLPPLDGDGGV